MSPTYSTATIQAPATLLDFLLVPSKMHSLLARLGSPDVWQRQFLVSLVTETKKKEFKKVRCSSAKFSSEFLFPSLLNGAQLTSSAISSIAKNRLEEVGVNATHHALRRGSANALQAEGLSLDEIMERGRWRSKEGLLRYLQDNPSVQGFKVEESAEDEEAEVLAEGVEAEELAEDVDSEDEGPIIWNFERRNGRRDKSSIQDFQSLEIICSTCHTSSGRYSTNQLEILLVETTYLISDAGYNYMMALFGAVCDVQSTN
ncbi:hypothetical protein L3Y34_010932 [Caenorhabditis briggsae]|uniref:Tyr recombinase domain-containing protein n=1 Tax=Caenorhabditis briggsae TaxID=6238 RepID=A0AAE9CTS9_CAEBR|nr:hypothetical protein L3Y34_010932 [Caenorhabditis briggsae]